MLWFCLANCSFAQPPLPTNYGKVFLPLDTWQFSDTNWLSTLGYAPVSFTNIINVTGAGDGNALLLDTTNSNPAFLFYNAVETNGTTNIICSEGSITFWFNPDWSGTNQGGTGPGDWANFVSLGQWGTNGSSWWALYASSDGSTVYFAGQTNGGSPSIYLSAPVRVRRATAADLTGATTIQAEIFDANMVSQGFQEVPINSLLSPKEFIDLSGSGAYRWNRVLQGTQSGATLPPIQITPGSIGTPIRNVTIGQP